MEKSDFYIKGKKNGKALLVEPGYCSKYPSLGLLKLSTYLKKKGYFVDFVKGARLSEGNYDEILVTTLFTFDWRESIDTINHYSKSFPNANIRVGGLYASLMPEDIQRKTGIAPFVGCIEEVDECPPDYTLLPSQYYFGTSRLFTSRGCPRACGFCGTRLFEHSARIIRSWKNHFMPEGRFAIIHDNNILGHGDSHFQEVLNYLREKKIRFIFDNGFDCRIFEKKHANIVATSPISEVRFSFDTMDQDGFLQKAIRGCLQAGIKPWRIKVFVLYNYLDDIDEALYRAKEVRKLRAIPYAMRYRPLNWLEKDKNYVSAKWSESDLVGFHFFVNKYWNLDKFQYEQWKNQQCNRIHGIVKIKDVSKEEWFQKFLADKSWEAESRSDPESIFRNKDFILSLMNSEEETKSTVNRAFS